MDSDLLQLYSRQIGTFGLQAMQSLFKLKVLIVGLTPVGVEIAKNIVLAGPKTIMLYDRSTTEVDDLSANYYVNESCIDRVERADAVKDYIAKLNGNVTVNVIREPLTQLTITNFDLCIVCNKHDNEVSCLNNICRSANTKFISVCTYGLAGSIFVDFGDKFHVFDATGEKFRNFIVERIIIKNKEPTVFFSEKLIYDFSVGDQVSFVSVKSNNELVDKILSRPEGFKVKKLFRESITLEEIDLPDDDYVLNANMSALPRKLTLSFKPFAHRLVEPLNEDSYGLPAIDFELEKQNEQMWIFFRALHQYLENVSDSTKRCYHEKLHEQIFNIAKHINERLKTQNSKMHVEKLSENKCLAFTRLFSCNFSPLITIIGGIAAQEAIKCTGKYTPINQWFHYDCLNLVKQVPYDSMTHKDDTSSRYRHLEQIFTPHLSDILRSSRVFVIGMGALGCEYMKGLAMLGIGSIVDADNKELNNKEEYSTKILDSQSSYSSYSESSSNGTLYITDPDSIEVSNLNRQFLFHSEHVGQNKAQTACLAAKTMNSDLNITVFQNRLCASTENVFNRQFWKNLDCVLNGLDNVDSRLYVDNKCVQMKLPLVDAGTLGLKCNSQVIVPYLTESYSDSRDPEEDAIPLCTLRHFPNKPEHCLEWATDQFYAIFTNMLETVGQLLTNKVNVNSTKQAVTAKLRSAFTEEQLSLFIPMVYDILQCKATPNGDKATEIAIQIAVNYYIKHFNHNIKQLLYNFPPDAKTSEGTMFWSGGKRCPKPATLDVNDELCVKFVQSFSFILLSCLHRPAEANKVKQLDVVKNLISKSKVTEFVAKKVHIGTSDDNENHSDNEQESIDNYSDIIENIVTILSELDDNKIDNCEFEKDDPSNMHVTCLSSTGNLRCRCYSIEEVDEHSAMLISGKIIPAVATTTAVASGFALIELIRVLLRSKLRPKLADYRNMFGSLADCQFIISEPSPAQKNVSKDFDPIVLGPVKAKPEGFTKWDSIQVNISLNATLQDAIDTIEQVTECNVTMISVDSICLYMSYDQNSNTKKKSLLYDLIGEIRDKEYIQYALKQNYVFLSVCCEDNNGVDVLVPTIECIFI